MTNFQDLKDKPDAFLSLTGHTLEEFTELLPHFHVHMPRQLIWKLTGSAHRVLYPQQSLRAKRDDTVTLYAVLTTNAYTHTHAFIKVV